MRASNKGFTLIELVIVLVLIGILAAVAIPRFHDMKTNAEEASIRGTLGNVRSAITIWRANALANGTDSWPALADVQAGGTVLDSTMPDNPWATANASAVEAGVATTVDGDPGWRYEAASGSFWANSSGNTENEW